MSSKQHGAGHLDLPKGTWFAHALAVGYADFRQHVRLPHSHMLDAVPNSTLAFDVLHLDDHEFSGQVVARLSRSQDCPTGALGLHKSRICLA